MSVIVRNKCYVYVNDHRDDVIETYIFNKFDDCWTFLNDVVFKESVKSGRIVVNELLKYYVETSEFNLDFDNHRFFANGNSRYFKRRYEGDLFDQPNSGRVEESFPNILLDKQWFENNVETVDDKNVFGNIKSTKQVCKRNVLIPTRQTIPISLRYFNINREIKFTEF